MKKQFLYLGLVVFILTMGTTNVQAAAPLEIEAHAQFNLGWPGPQTNVPDWVGTVNINGHTYGIAWFNIGSGKTFDNAGKSQAASFFGEIWRIYDSISFQFDSNGVLTSFHPGNIVITGNDQGVVSFPNSAYRMNGVVQDAPGSAFSVYLGHTVHMSGLITWWANGNPLYADGPIRIN